MRKYMVLLVFLVLFTCAAQPAYARGLLQDSLDYVREAEVSVMYGYASRHWISKGTTNSTHHLIGIRVDNVTFGRFTNSYGRESYYLGYYKDFGTYDGYNFFSVLGFMRGYTTCYGDDDSNTNTCLLIAGGISYTGWGQIEPALYQLGDASVIGLKANF